MRTVNNDDEGRGGGYDDDDDDNDVDNNDDHQLSHRFRLRSPINLNDETVDDSFTTAIPWNITIGYNYSCKGVGGF